LERIRGGPVRVPPVCFWVNPFNPVDRMSLIAEGRTLLDDYQNRLEELRRFL